MYRLSPFDDLFYVVHDFDSLFSRYFPDLRPRLSEALKGSPAGVAGASVPAPAAGDGSPSTACDYVPAVESFTRDGKLFIRAELPGVDPAELNVTVTGNKLQISGEKKMAGEMKEADVYFREISQGRFERNFTLPRGLRNDQLAARFENGVLELTVPVPEAAQATKIPIDVVSSGKQVSAA